MVENVRPTEDLGGAAETTPGAAGRCAHRCGMGLRRRCRTCREAGKQPVLIPWQVFPSMQVNAGFVEQLQQAGLTPEHKIYFLCRSGARSLAAAQAAQAAGFPQVYNIADGFEGPPDGDGHRGKVAGWKADGLPWRQR